MKNAATLMFMMLVLLSPTVFAQAELDDDERLKLTALEALVSAPPERALPLAAKALRGSNSDAVKKHALFLLGQIDHPDARALLLQTAAEGEGDLRLEAIRMLGIDGDPDSLSQLGDLYAGGDERVRRAVLDAYLIADDAEAVYRVAVAADDEREFMAAVDVLGAMDATDQLRRLREEVGVSAGLINAYAVSGDAESLRELALDDSDPAQQARAIEALGIVGGDEVGATLVEIYRQAASDRARDAALRGMLIAGHDEGVLELYRASNDAAEKRQLLEYLVMMDSDAVWDLIDSALAEGE